MKWNRPDGSTIYTNDNPATIKHCESLGWTEAKAAPKKKAAKKKAKKKAD